jgi:hypothetical protein
MALPSLKATTALQGTCQSGKMNWINALMIRPRSGAPAKIAERQENPAKDSAQTACGKLSLTIATYLH